MQSPGFQIVISGAIQEADPGGENKEHISRLIPRGIAQSQVDEPSPPEDRVRHGCLQSEASTGV